MKSVKWCGCVKRSIVQYSTECAVYQVEGEWCTVKGNAGGDVRVRAGGDVRVHAGGDVAGGDVRVRAGGDVRVHAGGDV